MLLAVIFLIKSCGRQWKLLSFKTFSVFCSFFFFYFCGSQCVWGRRQIITRTFKPLSRALWKFIISSTQTPDSLKEFFRLLNGCSGALAGGILRINPFIPLGSGSHSDENGKKKCIWKRWNNDRKDVFARGLLFGTLIHRDRWMDGSVHN